MITLKTLPQATAQEVFDQGALHLLKQNKRSALDPDVMSSGCLYRTRDGLMCAGGCFIAPDEYHPQFEGKSWTGLVGGKFSLPGHHASLIYKLQNIHDDYNPVRWEGKLRELAAELNLSPIVLDQFKVTV